MDKTKRRVTFEWALISNENDGDDVARNLGRLLKRVGLRTDLCHVNCIPLNPTDGYDGKKSSKERVNAFCSVLKKEFGIAATPRVRRGIDIEAGCGQLSQKLDEKRRLETVMHDGVGLDVDIERKKM